MPTNVVPVGRYRLLSQKWGDARVAPFPFHDKWQRLRASAREVKLSRDARKRLEWFIWYDTLGRRNARATCRHFGIAPKVFYAWKKRLNEKNLLSLEERSRRPKHVRQPTIHRDAAARIFELRQRYLHYSKYKIAVLYKHMYGEAVSTWQVQKIIERHGLYPNRKRAENTAKKRRRAVTKKRITDLLAEPRTGFLFSIDTVVLYMSGEKRYVLTAIDRHSRLAYARMYTTHTSKSAADFLHRLYILMDGQIVHIQTDNGSEFHHNFLKAVEQLGLGHWWSRVRHPKDNARLERFNRTIQEEFIGCGNAYTDPVEFNRHLTEWLIEYDFNRPHAALGYRSPIETACPDEKALPMYSSRTSSCAGASHPSRCSRWSHVTSTV